MDPPKPKAPAKSRHPLFLNIPEAERARLGTFAETVGRQDTPGEAGTSPPNFRPNLPPQTRLISLYFPH